MSVIEFVFGEVKMLYDIKNGIVDMVDVVCIFEVKYGFFIVFYMKYKFDIIQFFIESFEGVFENLYMGGVVFVNFFEGVM